ncbi:MAG TPA: hypothetical protein VLV86_14060 [Vicinamibacterales bacterium]|nr:hypothetical protein [Vicinamibacterales bacterium]
MRSLATALVIFAGALAPPAVQAQTKSADKAFVRGGKVDVHLDAGDYEVRAAPDDHIRVTMNGQTGNATIDVVVNGKHADVIIRNTWHTNFKCIVEVPRVSDVAIRLSAGDLRVGPITGSKDIESSAGDMNIAVGNPDDYSSVDASVSVGDLSGGPFGNPDGGFVAHSIKKSGRGTRTFRAHLGAGDLKLE